jgi:hypothetical protein
MKTKLILLLTLLVLSGCKSEVDKCVDAFVKSQSDKSGAIEFAGRIICLKAQAGKD